MSNNIGIGEKGLYFSSYGDAGVGIVKIGYRDITSIRDEIMDGRGVLSIRTRSTHLIEIAYDLLDEEIKMAILDLESRISAETI